jgi:hypothetical protein
MKHKFFFIKSAKARVTGTIPYCRGDIILIRGLIHELEFAKLFHKNYQISCSCQ